MIYWLVVWIFLFFPMVGMMIQSDEYFSEGLKPPTMKCWAICRPTKMVSVHGELIHKLFQSYPHVLVLAEPLHPQNLQHPQRVWTFLQYTVQIIDWDVSLTALFKKNICFVSISRIRYHGACHFPQTISTAGDSGSSLPVELALRGPLMAFPKSTAGWRITEINN